MRKFCKPALCRAKYFDAHGKPRLFSIRRSFHLQENEEVCIGTKDEWHTSSMIERTEIGFKLPSELHLFRKSQAAKILNYQSPKASINLQHHFAQMGFYRGLLTGTKTETEEKVERAFLDASTIEELKASFRTMETVFDSDDKKLGMACLRMGQKFNSAGEDPQKILTYAERALGILEKHNKNSVEVAMSLHLMGSIHYALNKFGESLGYLNRANKMLEKLEKEDTPMQTKPISFAVQILLGNVKTVMGRNEDAMSNYTKGLKLKEEIVGPDHPHMAVTIREVVEALVAAQNFKDALPLCLKTLDLHRKQLGENSAEVATDRQLLGVIYGGLGEDKKALEEYEAAKKILQKWGMNKELIYSELYSANVQISLGKYEDAIDTLRGVIQKTNKDSKLRATALLYMSKALCQLEKYDESKKCCALATNLFKKFEQKYPREVAEAYTELGILYHTMNDFEASISLYKKAIEIYEISYQDPNLEARAKGQLGYLLLLTGKVEEAISNLEGAALMLEESFGPHYFGVGYIYNDLGVAYEELERPQTAVQMFVKAREIMEIALGPQHMDTLDTIQKLANVHGLLGSYSLAIDFQQMVIDALENHGPSAKNKLKEAQRRLADLKRQTEEPVGKPLKNEMPDQSVTGNELSEADMSDDQIETSEDETESSEDETESSEDLEDNRQISLDELKELQGLLAELAELEGWDQKPLGKPNENDTLDHKIIGNQLVEKNMNKKAIENTEKLKDQGSFGINELKELQGLLSELIDLERQAQNSTGKSLKNDKPDYNIIGKHSKRDKNARENEMDSTEALRDHAPLSVNELKEFQGLVSELRRQARKRVGSSTRNNMPDHDIPGKRSTGQISKMEIQKTDSVRGKLLTKKNSRMSEIESADSIRRKLLNNLTQKNVTKNEIQDTDTVSRKLKINLTKKK